MLFRFLERYLGASVKRIAYQSLIASKGIDSALFWSEILSDEVRIAQPDPYVLLDLVLPFLTDDAVTARALSAEEHHPALLTAWKSIAWASLWAARGGDSVVSENGSELVASCLTILGRNPYYPEHSYLHLSAGFPPSFVQAAMEDHSSTL